MKELAKLLVWVGMFALGLSLIGSLILTLTTGKSGDGPLDPAYYPWVILAGGGLASMMTGQLLATESYSALVLIVLAVSLGAVSVMRPEFPEWVAMQLGAPAIVGLPLTVAVAWIIGGIGYKLAKTETVS